MLCRMKWLTGIPLLMSVGMAQPHHTYLLLDVTLLRFGGVAMSCT